jgi:hypothetical protein
MGVQSGVLCVDHVCVTRTCAQLPQDTQSQLTSMRNQWQVCSLRWRTIVIAVACVDVSTSLARTQSAVESGLAQQARDARTYNQLFNDFDTVRVCVGLRVCVCCCSHCVHSLPMCS